MVQPCLPGGLPRETNTSAGALTATPTKCFGYGDTIDILNGNRCTPVSWWRWLVVLRHYYSASFFHNLLHAHIFHVFLAKEFYSVIEALEPEPGYLSHILAMG